MKEVGTALAVLLRTPQREHSNVNVKGRSSRSHFGLFWTLGVIYVARRLGFATEEPCAVQGKDIVR